MMQERRTSHAATQSIAATRPEIDARSPITGVVHRPVSPRADTGPFVSGFSAHTATELVVGPVSAAAGFTP